MKFFAAFGALLLALAVMMGAFGAHALKDKLDAYSLGVYEKAVFYHFIHALGVLLVVIFAKLELITASKEKLICILLILGILIFSGSLYLLAISGMKWLGAITPIGGTMFIVAWVLLALALV